MVRELAYQQLACADRGDRWNGFLEDGRVLRLEPGFMIETADTTSAGATIVRNFTMWKYPREAMHVKTRSERDPVPGSRLRLTPAVSEGIS